MGYKITTVAVAAVAAVAAAGIKSEFWHYICRLCYKHGLHLRNSDTGSENIEPKIPNNEVF